MSAEDETLARKASSYGAADEVVSIGLLDKDAPLSQEPEERLEAPTRSLSAALRDKWDKADDEHRTVTSLRQALSVEALGDKFVATAMRCCARNAAGADSVFQHPYCERDLRMVVILASAGHCGDTDHPP